MKSLCLALAAAVLSIAFPAYAQRGNAPDLVLPNAENDPLFPIYRTSGVADDGGAANTGWATAIHCTNLSSSAESLQVILRQHTGQVLANQTFFIGTTTTITIVTHIGTVFPQDHNLISAGTPIDQGNFTITATSTNIYCSVMVFDAAATSPVGILLHMIRFNPMAGSTE